MKHNEKKYETETPDLIPNDNGEKYLVSLNSEQARQLIEIKTCVAFPKKKWWGISQKPKGTFKLEIIDLNASIFVLDEARKQEFITFNDTKKAECDIEVNDYKVPFILVLDPTVITDLDKNLADLQEREVTVTYKIQSSQNGKTYYTTDSLYLRLEIQKTDPKPLVGLELEKKNVKFDPSCKEKVQIGKIKINHSLPLHCAPELQATFKFNAEYGDTKLNYAISLGDKAHETNPYSDRRYANIKVQGTNSSVLNYSLQQTSNQQTEYTLRHIKGRRGGNEISIPVYLDMQHLENPKEDEQCIELSITGMYQATETGKEVTGNISASRTFTLKKNKQVNKLEVECDDNLCKNNGVCDNGPIKLNSGFTCDFVLTLRNAATVTDPSYPNAGIRISNFRTTQLAYDKKRLVLANGLNAEQYFRFAPTIIEEAMLRPTEKMEKNQTSLILSIKSDDIADIVKDDTQGFTLPMELTYEFDYIEGVNAGNDIEGYGQEKHFKGHIRWKLSKPANPEWLSVDFGTSAIVATFARLLNNNPDTNLLDLKAKKEELLKRTYKTDAARRKDEQPEPAPFISSDICYNSVNSGPYDAERADDDFKTYPLWLSPTTGMADIKLPCLKSLIGNQVLPDILSRQEQNTFRYKELQDGNEIEVGLFTTAGNQLHPNQLAKIDIILECAYKQLFKHYICQSNPEGTDGSIEYDKVNKLVLSVPNTFTPKHHAQLRELAKKIFPNLYPEYLQVVNESDAVACYYIYNRYKFFQNTDGLIENNREQELESKEHVLVFDMGAGTLDLTYFIKQTTLQGVTTIDMQGKLGVSKAGNYLDYLLAEILCDFLEANEHEAAEDFRKWMELDKMTRERQNTPKKHCEALKDYVKNQVKPLLNYPDKCIPDANIGEHKITFTSKENGTTLTVNNIKQNKKYQQYIRECTEETLDNLVELFGEQPQSIIEKDTPQLDIDVLIFSGRSSTLNDIREAVAGCIKKYCNHDILYADLISTTLSKSPLLQTKNMRSKPLKTAVSFGALLYADWINRPKAYQFKGRKIFAQYGALIHCTTNTWDWILLIDCHTQQINRPRPTVGKAPVWFSESKNINLQTAQEILFVQSYSKQTLEDWINGKRDMISEMGSYYVQGNMGHCDIGIEIDANNVIRFYIDKGYINCYPSDDFKNPSLRKSLWPVVFNL